MEDVVYEYTNSTLCFKGTTQSWKAETTFHNCWGVKSSFKLVWMESISPCDSLIGYSVDGALLLIGLTQIYFWQIPFLAKHPCVKESPFGLDITTEHAYTI